MQDEYWPLAEAVALALVHGGIEVMDSPGRLLAYIADLMDPECYEISVLMLLRRCNDRLVGPYRRAIGGGQGALRDAEARACDYLEHECVIDSGAAAAIAQGFAKGVARFQGALPSFQMRVQEWTDPQSWPTAPSRSRGQRGDSPGMRLDDDRTLVATQDSQGDKTAPRTTDISGARFDPIAPQCYTGKPLRPELAVTLGGVQLVNNRDYLLFYSGNVGRPERVTVATVTATGIGAYSGSASTTFRIRPPAPNTPVANVRHGGFQRHAVKPVQSRQPVLIAISAGGYHTVALRSDGTAVATGDNRYGQCDVSGWSDLVSVSAGGWHTVGLRKDGTAVAVGSGSYEGGRCDVSSWHSLTAVSAGFSHTVGLRSDGTVVATGSNSNGQSDVSGWHDIVAVSVGTLHTVGLRKDGTAVAVGWNNYGQCDVSEWRGLVAVSAGGCHTIGLRSDGTVVAAGSSTNGSCDVSEWRGLVAVSAGGYHTVGLRFDSVVVAVGGSSNGRCDVSGWRDIIAVSAGEWHTVGLRSDGTVVATGNNEYGQCDVSGW